MAALRPGEPREQAGTAQVQTLRLGAVRVLRLPRFPSPALAPARAQALEAALAEAEADAGCRGVVLTGEPGVFCSGLAPSAPDAPAARELVTAVNSAIARLYAFARPCVAAISGDALGVGLVLALACDLRLAAEGTYEMGLPPVATGFLHLEGVRVVVHDALDPRTARRLMLGAESSRPRGHLARAFIDEVTEPELLLERACARCMRLAELPGFAGIKRQLRAPALSELERVLPPAGPSRARGPGGG